MYHIHHVTAQQECSKPDPRPSAAHLLTQSKFVMIRHANSQLNYTWALAEDIEDEEEMRTRQFEIAQDYSLLDCPLSELGK